MEQIETAAGSAAVAASPPQSAAPDAAPVSGPAPEQPAPKANAPKIPTWEEAFKPKEPQLTAAVKDAAASTSAPQPAPEAKPATAEQPAATDGEPVPASDDAATVKPDGQPGTDRPRREGAREKAEREKAELTAEVNRVIAERDALKAAEDERRAADATQRAGYEEAIGSDAEFERLTYLNNTGQALDAQQWDNLQRWTTTRNFRRYFERDATAQAEKVLEERLAAASRQINAQDLAFRQGIADRAQRLSQLDGADPATITGSDDFEVIGRHLHAAGAASRDAEVKELKDTLSQRDARIRELETIAATRQPIPAGGRSGTGRGTVFDPKASAADNWERAGFH